MAGLTTDQVRQLFAQEAEVRLPQLGKLLLELEEAGHDDELVRSIFREVHTLKGSSAVAGLDEVSRIAHGLEEIVDELRAGRRSVTAEIVDTLLAGVDELTAAITASQSADTTTATPLPEVPAATKATEATEATVANTASTEAIVIPIPLPANPRQQSGAGTGVIMVPVERLDELNRLVGETATAHLRIGRMLKDRFALDPATCTEFNELSRALNELQDRVIRAQMVPVSTITDTLHRAVRELARAQGKDVRWDTRGADTELDRGVLSRLADSLMHLVRNAVDHGIETPAERLAAGKPAQATLRLHAMQLGSEVIIAVTDDGRGIDVAAVRGQAERRGIDVEGMSEAELLRLTFQPGLSTTAFVTDVSGRGVGLDVVRTNVEAAHGRVEVRNDRTAGTEFRIIVPITVAVLRCLLVEAGGRSYALPFHRVKLSQAHDAAATAHAEGRPVVTVDGHPVPLSGLAETLGLPGGASTDGPLVVLTDTSRQHAFQVDRLIGQRDVVLKALNPLLPHLPAVAGASVEPDGSVLLVLDPPGLIGRARTATRISQHSVPVEVAQADRRTILVVDDALTVRELQRSILERAGFIVRLATDGKNALADLAEAPSDLVLTDIEMPNMDGFALTEAIRADPSVSNIPVLILSSRSSEADKQRGLDVGADGYIVKSGFDGASLISAVNRLLGIAA
jgi:two-component system, chemotaxis family, sensor kinase CheA